MLSIYVVLRILYSQLHLSVETSTLKKNKTSVTLFFGRNAKVRGELPLQYAMSRMGGVPGPDDDTKVLYPELVPSLVSRVGTGEQGWSCDS